MPISMRDYKLYCGVCGLHFENSLKLRDHKLMAHSY